MESEKDILKFFFTLLNGIAHVVLFLMIGVLFGMYYEFAYFKGSPDWKNWVFYIVYAVLFVILIKRLRKIWGNK